MEFAISPHAKRRVNAEAVGIKMRQDAWGRTAYQVRDYLEDPQWNQEDLAGDTGLDFSAILRRIGVRHFPLYF